MELSESINQKVQAGVIFKNALIHPAWFIWDGRRYNIKEINYRWQMTKGLADIYFFSVSDGVNSYELSFNTREMTWVLTKALG